MYNIHHTEGIILSSRNAGEADRIYTIYSKDFGKIAVFAKGVRLEKSKLRSHLNLYSFIRLSFVEGRDFLRLTDGEEIMQPSLGLSLPACAGRQAGENIFYLMGRASSFIERMIRGQEKDEPLWNTIHSGFHCLYSSRSIPEFFEPLFKARLLHRLGYVSAEKETLDEVITEDDWTSLSISDTDHKNLEKIYAESLIASQL